MPIAVILGFATQHCLLPQPEIAPFVFFYFSVTVASWAGGRLPGLSTVLVSALVANYFFVAPFRAWATSSPALTATGLFVLASAGITLLCASLRTAMFEAERTSQVLRRQAELIRLSHDAILVERLGGPIESWNRGAEELYGYAEHEALGTPVTELLSTELPEPLEHVVEALQARGRWDGELVQHTKNGTRVIVSAKLQLLRGEDGIERVLGSHREITERTEAEKALRASDQRKSEFLAMLSHELRNPLAPIVNGLYILDRAAPGSEQARRAKAIVDRQVGQLKRLVDDILDTTRIAHGKLQVQRRRLLVGPLLRRTIADHRPLFEMNGIELTTEITERPLVVDGDEARLAQAIGNLLNNAAKFTNRGGHVFVGLAEDADSKSAVLRVSDDGPGIDPALVPRLFQPFEQGDRTLERSGGGLGLGLALVRGLVEQHGGAVEVESRGVGGSGSTFVVRLPLAESVTEVADTFETVPDAKHRVLVIDDNADAAQTLRDALELGGHEVTVALDGPRGLAKAREYRPDVVFCDVGLPGMDGYAVARSFRGDPGLKDTELIALTGYGFPEDSAKATNAGFDQHLVKPADSISLRAALARATEARGLH